MYILTYRKDLIKMKLKPIAAALIAVMCVIPFAGCGEEKPSEAESSHSSQQQPTSYTYMVSDVEFKSKIDINSFISGEAVDMDGIAEAAGCEKTDKATTWTTTDKGARYNISLTDEKDGTYTGVSVTTATMDGKRETVTIRYGLDDKDKMLTFNKMKIPFKGIELATFAFENSAKAENKDPFSGYFDKFKNDKGDYYLPYGNAEAKSSDQPAETTKAADSE